ncbi:MAG: ribosome recycling factor [Bacteroidales bacterium]|nr:ribosome recycling factor [Bacteroidales bacterium]
MTEEGKFCIDMAKSGMDDAVSHLDKAFQKIRAGKAHPQMLDGVKVDSYGTLMPINQLASISTPDPKLIVVQPWDKNNIVPVEKAIMAANLGFNPMNDGAIIRIPVPELTEERRKELARLAKNEMENAKISIRNARRSAIDEAKSFEKEGMPEDESKRVQAEIQKLHDDYIKMVDDYYEKKEKEVLTI